MRGSILTKNYKKKFKCGQTILNFIKLNEKFFKTLILIANRNKPIVVFGTAVKRMSYEAWQKLYTSMHIYY